MFVSLKDPWVLNSLAVDESYCYNSMSALPPEVIASRIDNPNYTQWDSSCAISALCLKGAQFNVQTLLQFSSRKHLLANFIKQRFFFGCFQEARSKSGRPRCIDNVVMLASASDKGNYGCEVWVNLSSPVCVKGGKRFTWPGTALLLFLAILAFSLLGAKPSSLTFILYPPMPLIVNPPRIAAKRVSGGLIFQIVFLTRAVVVSRS